ncbi:hypothetical protein CPSG_02304 [Coccidioides posadasii str. Silveira]|uniref:Uncharacterized protein n=1 Tax=Coccidioides posadasii (strain RMSCC 757 / Silveira) TaxID=443226 RepID=E9CZ17_COCPS|nr:hypothetical protein CPSG_02304 [Coccidioides posadasii str. Silveira]
MHVYPSILSSQSKTLNKNVSALGMVIAPHNSLREKSAYAQPLSTMRSCFRSLVAIHGVDRMPNKTSSENKHLLKHSEGGWSSVNFYFRPDYGGGRLCIAAGAVAC